MLTIAADEVDFTRWLRVGDRVAWGQAAAEPLLLTRELVAQRHRIGGRFSVFLGAAWSPTITPDCTDVIDAQAYCGAGHHRALAAAGLLDVLCCHYSDFARALGPGGACQVDVLLLQVAPSPDGGFSLSLAHEYLAPLVDSARVVIAEVNRQAPWTYGARALSAADIDFAVWSDRPLPNPPVGSPSPVEAEIARRVADQVEDGATLQLGIGALPEAVLAQLADRRDLGIHSGAIGDGVAELMERGVITNARKSLDRGHTVAGVMMGGPRLAAAVHCNPLFQFRPTSYTHDAQVLAEQDGLVAINSALEVDLSGQINAEQAGHTYVGAVGGAVDFLRGARSARRGLPIVALPSRARQASRIVAALHGPVSTARSDAGLVITEHGVADLRGASLAQRVRRMLDIAHPDDRCALEREFHLQSRKQA